MHPIRFEDEGRAATRELVARFEEAARRWTAPAVEDARRHLATLEALDRQYGGSTPLDLEDTEAVVAAALSEVAHVGAVLDKVENEAIDAITLGIALWALRHDVAITVPEPVVNALARRSNEARSRQELAAAFGLMQSVIDNVAPRLEADLERSNPERPWRLLHLNLAITAIRTNDAGMMDFAFDALENALPDERAGFFAEALALALAPGVDPEVRNRIEARHLKWTGTT